MAEAAFTATTHELKPDTGIDRNARKKIAEGLSQCLADTFVTFTNTLGVHWNVEGPLFYSIHKLTEEQYEDQFAAIDDLAERIRTLGFASPQTMGHFRQLSGIEDLHDKMSVEDMVGHLVSNNEALAKNLRVAAELAEEHGDIKTADLLTERLGEHEENAWMLRAILSK